MVGCDRAGGWREDDLDPLCWKGSRPSLVVRGAGAAGRSGFPIPLSIRTCGFPAYGLPMIFLAWLSFLRVADGAPEPVQAVPVEPLLSPLPGLPGVQVATAFADHQ